MFPASRASRPPALRTLAAVAFDGTLLVNGTAASPCVFTDLGDDSAGGDTNGDGPSTGTPTSWYGFVLRSTSDASVLSWADVRYGGHAYVSNLELDQSDATLTHCTARNCYTAGMDLNANSRPTVSDCAFVDNGSYAIQDAAIDAVPGFTNNTASGNAGGTADYLLVTGGVVKIEPQARVEPLRVHHRRHL